MKTSIILLAIVSLVFVSSAPLDLEDAVDSGSVNVEAEPVQAAQVESDTATPVEAAPVQAEPVILRSNNFNQYNNMGNTNFD